ncbi:threonine--tRNA ligase, cytoplasmic-like [Helianthus annuus]|uniref:threonine--tRNA ligase, cytoplasmic-like n=1 Tax=Helianthus annuus TaxID=4232 RepID=UPI0016533AFA|nr:threonine--tRNA ligase, cytoplasmic-like [Helianthus annuus]
MDESIIPETLMDESIHEIHGVTLPDGTVKERKKWETTPVDIAKELSKSLASNALISQVDGVLWDMSMSLEGAPSSLLSFFCPLLSFFKDQCNRLYGYSGNRGTIRSVLFKTMGSFP